MTPFPPAPRTGLSSDSIATLAASLNLPTDAALPNVDAAAQAETEQGHAASATPQADAPAPTAEPASTAEPTPGAPSERASSEGASANAKPAGGAEGGAGEAPAAGTAADVDVAGAVAAALPVAEGGDEPTPAAAVEAAVPQVTPADAGGGTVGVKRATLAWPIRPVAIICVPQTNGVPSAKPGRYYMHPSVQD